MLFVNAEIEIPDDDLKFTFVRSGGPGGQAVNKVNSKAELRWNFAEALLPFPVRERFLARFGARLTLDGELIITSDRHRDRLQNRQDCLDKLREMLLAVAVPPKPRKKTKPGRGARLRAKALKQRQGAKKRARSGQDWGD
jgi:ribosome-associated protein